MPRLPLHTIADVAMSAGFDARYPATATAVDSAVDYGAYRALSSSAVLSCAAAVASPAALLDYWPLKAIPAVGFVVGLVALRRIARHPDELTGQRLARIGVIACGVLLAAGSALSVWNYYAEVPDGCVRIGYEQLRPMPERPNDAPTSVAALDGRRVFIKGFMFPTSHDRGITRFVLCRDNGDCCFGGRPPKSDMIFVELTEPLQTEFTTRIRGVAGTFRVAGVRSTDVGQDVLYRLEADHVQ